MCHVQQFLRRANSFVHESGIYACLLFYFLYAQKGFTAKVCTASSCPSFTNLPFCLLIPIEQVDVYKVVSIVQSLYIIHEETQATQCLKFKILIIQLIELQSKLVLKG